MNHCETMQGERGWRSGESTRLPPIWPGFKSLRRRHMWLEFVIGSLLARGGFSPGTQAFPSSQKPIFPNSNPIWNARTSLNEWLRMLHGTHYHSLSYNRSSQATFSQIGRPVATQSSLKSIVAISPSSGKTRAMLSAVVPANVPGKQKMHLLVSWLV